MLNFNFSIDLHCHPNYKPFARSHRKNGQPPTGQSASHNDNSSLWYYDPPSITDKLANYMLGVTKFRQHSLTSALYGRLFVMVVGMGSVEKFFFKNKMGTGFITDLIDDFAAGFGRPRINAIEAMDDYWDDLQKEMLFMESRENVAFRIDRHWYTYRFAKNFAGLLSNMQQNELPNAGRDKGSPLVISIVPSIEGMHVLNCGLESPCDPTEVLNNARALKTMSNAPWFVTFSHHFYNELCGHARSLRREIGKLTNQEEGINSGFTPLGLQVLDILMDPTLGRRIFIDIKHMSAAARKDFMEFRKQRYEGEIPVIISHGVCNGLPTYGATVSDYPELGNSFINALEDVIGGDGEFKDHNLINFFDDEILEVEASKGIIGLQLDERRLASEKAFKEVKHSVFRNKIMHYRSELVWKQIQYIAELLDANDRYAWGSMAIGSDYDGLVDPLNAFWSAEQYEDLAGYIERHAYNYFRDHSGRLKHSFNKVSADLVIQNLFRDNAWEFFRRWF